MEKITVIGILLCLTGCSTAITVTSVGVWGATGKTVTDHAISKIKDEDCVSGRMVLNRQVCQNAIYRQEEAFAERQYPN